MMLLKARSFSGRRRRHAHLCLVVLLFGALLVTAAASSLWPPQGPRVVVGVVRAPDGRPVSGAIVSLQGTAVRTRTGTDGAFRLLVPRRPMLRIAAAQPGYFNTVASVSDDRLTLTLHPLPEGGSNYRWIDPHPSTAEPHACGSCHVELYREWVASAHATSAINDRFLGVLYGPAQPPASTDTMWAFFRDRPDARAVCAPCHLPQAALGDPAMEDPLRLVGTAREGIHCDLCHKVTDVHADRLPLQHGIHAMELLLPRGKEQVFLGPLPDAACNGDAYSPVYEAASYCAACHEGTLFGTHVYRTYSEWLASPAAREGKTCQSCHMAPPQRRRNVARGHVGIDRPPATLSTHRFPGGDDERLLRDALQLALEVQQVERDRVVACVSVRAQLTGHRLPTGFPQRHLIVVVRAVDRHGNRLAPCSGPTLPAWVGYSSTLGVDLTEQRGIVIGRLFRDEHGQQPVPFWRAVQEHDTTLAPGEVVRFTVSFQLVHERRGYVEAVVLYRRLYAALEKLHRWPSSERIVVRQRSSW